MRVGTLRLLVMLVGAVAVLAAGCSSSAASGDPVEGIVTQVSGELGSVTTFVVLDDNGASHQFDPQPGLQFYGGPLDHLRDHIVTGQRVKVTYEEGAYGSLVAVLIEHTDGDTEHDH